MESVGWDWPGDQRPTLHGRGEVTEAQQGCRARDGAQSGVGTHCLMSSGAQVLSSGLNLPFPSQGLHVITVEHYFEYVEESEEQINSLHVISLFFCDALPEGPGLMKADEVLGSSRSIKSLQP